MRDLLDFCASISPYPPPKNLTVHKELLISSEAYKKILNFSEALYALSQHDPYRERVVHQKPLKSTPLQGQKGRVVVPILKEAPPNRPEDMSFLALDFHLVLNKGGVLHPVSEENWREANDVRLIEINTNAAFRLFAHDDSSEWLAKSLKPYFHSMEPHGGQKVFIIDDQIDRQELAFEFYFYKNLFESWGWECEICETTDFLKKGSSVDVERVGWVYNRCTDFFFEHPKHRHLREAYLSGQVRFAPNPMDYALLAHKQRLFDFSQESFWRKMQFEGEQALRTELLSATNVGDWEPEKLWESRAGYVFKPKMQHGGKGVFLGRAISRADFDSIVLKQDYLVQEYAPPPVREGWRWDLRVFVHQGREQGLLARLWKGDTTNRRMPGSGLARVLPVE